MKIPSTVAAASRVAEERGFALSCDPGVGQLLGVLSAAVRPYGSILELGTGAGVGTAWIVAGLGDRIDVRVLSVELDEEIAAVAAKLDLPSFVELRRGDALDVLRSEDSWSLIFADAQGGKWEGLDDTIDALEPGGMLLVDDMTPPEFMNDMHREKTAEVRTQLLSDPRLQAVEIAWSSGIILCARAHDA